MADEKPAPEQDPNNPDKPHDPPAPSQEDADKLKEKVVEGGQPTDADTTTTTTTETKTETPTPTPTPTAPKTTETDTTTRSVEPGSADTGYTTR